ncbi:transcriptional regulator, PadR family [Burkholderia mallei PRL-20]|nr:transcriptional regulator, PadR family [Burkholderia mallei SAVP1]AIP77438.1 hxlR-like helix-turn-helix family protein [Burkholderia mallei]EES45479.1 transcriptional regulator, PadR family [Burkholderia mallei PRL-20]AJX48480.1 hxlR-like helix-turn-helix family protein [Burkholderia mallei]AJX65464.1 hxlR-like helix-turn-helix family protein [Burkholderia mallei]
MLDAPRKGNVYASECPTRLVLDRIADKWTVLILALLSHEPLRFNTLLRHIEGLSQKVLSQTLKRLERDGLVARTVYATVPVSVEYALTPLGHTLAHSVTPIIVWSETHIDAVLDARTAYDARQGGGGRLSDRTRAARQRSALRKKARRINAAAI